MTTRQRVILIASMAVAAVLVLLGQSMLFTVNEREMAVVLQFGEPVATYTEPGLKVKLPFLQDVRRLPKTYQFWIGTGEEILKDLPTADGKKIEVTPWAVWRISDPRRFVEVLRTVDNAESRVKDFVRSAMRNVITTEDLAEVVRSTDRKLTYTFQIEPLDLSAPAPVDPALPVPTAAAPHPGADEKIEIGREKIVAHVKQVVQQRLAREGADPGGRGIELVDVGIAKIDFVDAVREEAFKRLIAFMESIASRYTNEGERRKQEILNRTEFEVQKIEGEGKGEANRIRGEIEAEIIKEYAEAIRETGEFFAFVRTLEAYKKAVGPNTRLVLTTDSELFRLLKEMPPAPEAASPDGPAPKTPQ